jgi:IS6 family transposase
LAFNPSIKSAPSKPGQKIIDIYTATPWVITVDKHTADPSAFEALQQARQPSAGCRLRQSTYLNTIVEQDHRVRKRRVNPGLGFGSFDTTRCTLQGYEAMHMIRTGQLQGRPKLDVLAQHRAIAQMFGPVA